ncbi:glycerate kinase [Paenibacillus senegalensis]|uniref:glycerate kinase n=1 Tax=Paenibacillus senegalensis TaxID=1465766 RepID=UPI00028A1022|nr:glycerate kinase [Paenibacillus senegalensis]
MKFVIAPDSYKGSLSSIKVGESMARAIRKEWPEAEICALAMADGGEGTVEAIVSSTGGKVVHTTATGPLGTLVESYWGISGADEQTAVLEAANVCGLAMVAEDRRNPLHTTSRGLGELLLSALNAGKRSFIIGLGGSATNDGGMGLLSALGAEFRDTSGKQLAGYGRDLEAVAAIDFAGLDPRLAESDIVVASDVTNPLCGPEGCSFIFGPQKGADAELVQAMDHYMAHYAKLIERHLGTTFQGLPGSGAAGGLGFALRTLGARLVPGAQVVAEAVRLDAHLADADWVITGEGMSDAQTLYGKLPLHVATAARRAGARCLLLSGSIGSDSGSLYETFDGCFSAVPRPADLAVCMRDAAENVYTACRQIVRLIRAAGSRSLDGTAGVGARTAAAAGHDAGAAAAGLDAQGSSASFVDGAAQPPARPGDVPGRGTQPNSRADGGQSC